MAKKKLEIDINKITEYAKSIDDENLLKLLGIEPTKLKPKRKYTKKNKTVVESEPEKPQTFTKQSLDNSIVQIKSPDNKNYGKTSAVKAQTKPYDPGTDKNDKANKLLKKFTKIKVKGDSNRKSTVNITCESCNNVEEINAALFRDNYICEKCLLRKINRGINDS